MKLTRRTLIKSAPVAAVPLAAMSNVVAASAARPKGSPVVVYEAGNPVSTEFADALPGKLRRFAIEDGGALQFEDLQALVADLASPLVGMTGASTFLLLQRLAAEEGRRFGITGTHEPCCDGGNSHLTKGGLAAPVHRNLPDHRAWIASLAQSYLGFATGMTGSQPPAAVSSRLGLTERLPRTFHSWILV